LTPETIALVKKQGTSIAHCPLSNAYFSSQIFPLRACLDAGIDVGLGSDCAGGHTLDLAVQMRHAVTASRLLESASPEPQQPAGQPVRITWQESLYLATRGGALALAEPLVGGRLQVGEFFDAQISTSFSLPADRCLDG
jgi:guanine deaminase